jgi:hypothetical protein
MFCFSVYFVVVLVFLEMSTISCSFTAASCEFLLFLVFYFD